MRRRRPFIVITIGVWLAGSGLAHAAGCRSNQPFDRWTDEIVREATAAGVSRTTLAAVQPYFVYDQSIVNKDRGQGVFAQSFLQFSDRMAAGYRIQKSAQLIKQHAATFAQIEKQFGVPPQPILAFWGLETDFGANIGDLPTLRSLVSLAYDCRRSELFQKELLAALKIVQRGDLRPDEMRGPWAGELGQLQFLPSHYFDYALDYDGDGRRDLLRNATDALGSAFLAYDNFDVFLKWNQSLVYATTAAYLATRIAGAPPVQRGAGNIPVLSAKEVFELQRLLAAHGYKPGKIDGKMGLETRGAVKQAQLKLGMPADSYPGPDLIERLRR